MFRRIRIQNYRSLRDVTVELGPVTVLVGRSGSGKTNFISAIRFLRDILGGPGQQIGHDGSNSLLPATEPNASMSFEVEFDVAGYGDPFLYSVTFQPGSPSPPPLQEFLRHGDVELFHQATESRGRSGQPSMMIPPSPSWIIPPSLVAPPQPGSIALGRLPGLEKVVMAYSVLATSIGVYSFPFSVLRSGNNNGTAGLNDDAANYLGILRELITSINNLSNRRQIAAALARLNPTVVSIDLNSIQQPTSAIVGHRLGEKTLAMDLSWESDGFRRFYAHLLALYQLPPKQLLIFEEPENGIYPGALSLLAEEFKAAAGNGRGQVLLTTHSPRLLDHFDADDIRVVELDDQLETRIGRLAHEQRDSIEEDLLETGELLTVDPARMETADS